MKHDLLTLALIALVAFCAYVGVKRAQECRHDHQALVRCMFAEK